MGRLRPRKHVAKFAEFSSQAAARRGLKLRDSEGDVHGVMVTIRVGDEQVAKDGKRRRLLDVMGFD